MDDPPNVHPDGVVWWVAEHTDISLEIVRTVLDLEFEFMVGVGIASSADPSEQWDFRFYDPAELEPLARNVDLDRIARDAELRAGVPYDVALRVLDGEMNFLQMRGLAGD